MRPICRGSDPFPLTSVITCNVKYTIQCHRVIHNVIRSCLFQIKISHYFIQFLTIMPLNHGLFGFIILMIPMSGLNGDTLYERHERGFIDEAVNMLWRSRATSRVRYAKKILLDGATPEKTSSRLGHTMELYQKPGGTKQAEKDFRAMNVLNAREVEDMITKEKHLRGDVGNNFVLFHRRTDDPTYYTAITIGDKRNPGSKLTTVLYKDM